MKVPLIDSLAGRIFGILFFAAIVPLMISISLALSLVSRTIVGAIGNSLENQCVLVGNDIDRFVQQRVAAARMLSQADTLEGDDVRKIRQYLVEASDAEPNILALDVVSPTGTLIASSRPEVESAADLVQKTTKEFSRLIAMCANARQGDVFVSEATQLSAGYGLLLATPITDDANDVVIKLLVVEIDMEQIQRIVSQFNDSVLGDKFVYIVDNAGRVVTTRDPKIGLLERFRDVDAQPELSELFSKQGEVGHLFYRDSDGDEVVAGYADLSEFGVNGSLDWSIIAVAPVDAILGPTLSMRNWMLGIGSVIMLLTLGLGWFLSESLIGPMRCIGQAAEQMRQGHYESQLPNSGLSEIDAISQGFHAMALDIADRERQLSESEHRWLMAVNASEMVSWDWEPDTGTVVWSEGYERLWGGEPGLFGGTYADCMARIHPDDRLGVHDALVYAREQNTTYKHDFRIVLPNSEIAWVTSCGRSLFNQSGESVRMLGMFLDITERKRAEDGLRQYQRMVSSSQDMMAMLNSDFAYVAVNDAYINAFGKTRHELVGHTVSDVFGPEFFDVAIRSHAERCLAGEELRYHALFDFPVHGSRYMDVAYSPYRDENKQVAGFVVCARDVTARKKAEDELSERNSRLQRVLDGMFVFVALMNLDGELIEVNHAPLEAAGLEKESVIGIRFWDSPWFVNSADARAQLQETFRRCAAGESVRADIPVEIANGQSIIADGVFTPLFDEAGRVTEIVGSAADVTQRIHAERELKHLNAELEMRVKERTAELRRTNEDLEAYAHSVAHDLRAPLRALFGFARALREDYGDQLDAEGREFTEFIESAALQMDNLTSDLLEYSKVGGNEVAQGRVDLDDVVKRALKQLEAEVDEHAPTLQIDWPLGAVIGHRSTLVQMVANLLSNAMKFVPAGKKVEIRIWNEIHDGANRLWIQDNGIGIDPNHHAKIFRVFERLHGIETYPGTGIGLAIVRRAVESMNGRFGVDSSPGDGSRFWVEFPLGVNE